MTAEVAVALWQASRQHGSDDEAAARTVAQQAVRSLRRYARAFPIGQPRLLLCQGLLAWISGQPARAQRAWRQSLAAAERLGMPYDQLLAHHQLAQHGHTSERGHHLTRAQQLFAELETSDNITGPEALAAHLP
jgi:eukaryotic-like serine/threonine-protein kinase